MCVCVYVCMYVCRFKHMASEATRASPRPDVLGTLAFAPTGAFPPPFLSDAKIAWTSLGTKEIQGVWFLQYKYRIGPPFELAFRCRTEKWLNKITTEIMVDIC